MSFLLCFILININFYIIFLYYIYLLLYIHIYIFTYYIIMIIIDYDGAPRKHTHAEFHILSREKPEGAFRITHEARNGHHT